MEKQPHTSTKTHKQRRDRSVNLGARMDNTNADLLQRINSLGSTVAGIFDRAALRGSVLLSDKSLSLPDRDVLYGSRYERYNVDTSTLNVLNKSELKRLSRLPKATVHNLLFKWMYENISFSVDRNNAFIP